MFHGFITTEEQNCSLEGHPAPSADSTVVAITVRHYFHFEEKFSFLVFVVIFSSFCPLNSFSMAKLKQQKKSFGMKNTFFDCTLFYFFLVIFLYWGFADEGARRSGQKVLKWYWENVIKNCMWHYGMYTFIKKRRQCYEFMSV